MNRANAPIPADAALPAPIWRRFAAAFYDGLLLLALWMTGALLAAVAQDLMELPANDSWQRFIRIYFFVLGLLFFGWFWTHGGQTPGLRAWRLRLQRRDGRPLRWPVAAVRYAVLLPCWGIALLPLLALAPPLCARFPLLVPLAWGCLALLATGIVSTLIDPLRRSPQDRCVSTQTMLLPKPTGRPRPKRHAESVSTDPQQSPQTDQPEQQGRCSSGQ